MEVFLLVTAGWVFSVCLHEFGHAVVAERGGDYTVREKGYLTLNPIHYTHPFYSLVLPIVFLLLGGIGLPGGAVYINDHLLRSKGWRSAVSLAGPTMNALLLLVICAPFWLGLLHSERTYLIACSLAFLAQLQVSAIVFNLIPVPPLDGFQAISPWLPEELTSRIMSQARVFTFVLFLVLWYVPPANAAFWAIVQGVSSLLGVSPDLAWEGWTRFQFWKHPA
jgi:Zn-dependent protease